MFNIPVVFCVFSRLDTTRIVFEKIRKVKPQKLYLVSDAPRADHPLEEKKVQEVRDYVENNIDWQCEIHKNYAEKNMGCGRRISSGISWVFKSEEWAIILEDDVVPEESFFQYCQEMLEYYKDNEDILLISGNNPVGNLYSTEQDYLFSKVPFLWGWATWKRAWELYDFRISTWPEKRKNPIWKKLFPQKAYWTYICEFDALNSGKYNDVWDYQLMYVSIIGNKLCVLPRQSHTYNIGFQEESTHTKNMPQWMSNTSHPVEFPIKYRKVVEWDRDFDEIYWAHQGEHGLVIKIKHMLGLDINRPIKEIITDMLRKR